MFGVLNSDGQVNMVVMIDLKIQNDYPGCEPYKIVDESSLRRMHEISDVVENTGSIENKQSHGSKTDVEVYGAVQSDVTIWAQLLHFLQAPFCVQVQIGIQDQG